MKEGIHPSYRDVCFVGPVQRLQVRDALVRADARDDQDGRRPRAAAVQARNHQRIASVLHRHAKERRLPRRPRREVPQQVRAPRREEVSAAAAHRQRQPRLPFSCLQGQADIAASLPRTASTDLNPPNPALVTQRAAQRLPRLALLLFCAAYVLPGLFGRDPWKSADITAFGYMLNIAQGRTAWLAPTVGGLPADSALLPYWLGAVFIRAARRRWSTPPLAARIPFALLLVLALVLTWYAPSTSRAPRPPSRCRSPSAARPTRRLRARHRRRRAAGADRDARPAAARPRDHARAGAAGQRRAVPLALAASPFRGARSAPRRCCWRCRRSPPAARPASPSCWASPAASSARARATTPRCAGALGGSPAQCGRSGAAWRGAARRLGAGASAATSRSRRSGTLLRLLVWFIWPAWLLALWTLWRWRRHLLHRHISCRWRASPSAWSPASRWAAPTAR